MTERTSILYTAYCSDFQMFYLQDQSGLTWNISGKLDQLVKQIPKLVIVNSGSSSSSRLVVAAAAAVAF